LETSISVAQKRSGSHQVNREQDGHHSTWVLSTDSIGKILSPAPSTKVTTGPQRTVCHLVAQPGSDGQSFSALGKISPKPR
jgi:hypothetical protein